MRLTKILLTLLLLLCTVPSWAVPARRVSITVEQPDGTQLVLTMRGDEHFHYLVTSDGLPVVKQNGAYYYALFNEEGVASSSQLAHEAGERNGEELDFIASMPDVQQAVAARMQRAIAKRSAPARAAEVPTRGEVRVPILLVQYADVKFSSSNPKETFQERINGVGYTAEGGCGSIREYFVEQSGGLLNPQFEIIGPITLDRDMEYYGANDKNGNDLHPREMVSDACRKAYSAESVNFARYDNNKDGYVDILYVIYAGYGEASHPDMLENTIWPHQWELEPILKLGGVSISRYACNNELDSYKGTTLDGIGTFCHEFSHCLGLPDFYDTSSSGKAFGMSSWSIMDQGCYNNNGHTPCNYNAYEKDFLGWISLVELNAPTQVTLKPLNKGGEAYKIVNDKNRNEFYVVEHFSKDSWNRYAPASGMVVMHIDYQATAWHNNTVNNDPDHQRAYVIPADGKSTTQSLASDVYPGVTQNTSLAATSHPAAKVYTGGYMNKDITNIASMDGVTTFTFMQNALHAPRVHTPSAIHSAGFTLTWDAVSLADSYEVQLMFLEEGNKETIVCTTRVDGCSYSFERLSEGVYRCSVRSVRQGICSDYSEPVHVQLTDAALPSAGPSPLISIHNDSITIQAAEGTEIYYTLDGSLPTIYSSRYIVPFVTKEKVTIKAIATREGHRNTTTAQLQNWFTHEGATYRITSTEPRHVVVSEARDGNGDEDYRGHYVFGDSIACDTAAYALVGFDANAFYQAMELRSVTVKNSSIRYIGDNLFHGCIALNAVIWDAPNALPDNAFDEDSYRNLLVYLPDTVEAPSSLLQGAYATVIKGGYCEKLVLDATSSFYCPREFTAGEVTYRRTFKQITGFGTSSGWETIALPFDVQFISHATKGNITPFGREGDKHYWLATPQGEGFASVTEICANTPYIIAMPNNAEYGDYSLNGTMTFSANQATIHTTNEVVVSKNSELTMTPTYEAIAANAYLYVLNVGSAYDVHNPGSVFVPNKYAVSPFTAYAIPSADTRTMPYYRIQSHLEVEEDIVNTPTIESRDGNIYISVTEPQIVVVYDAVGRVACRIACEVGVNVVTSLTEGIYLINKTKVYVRR